jgi:D-sedoheptulose 7-phosphate isomerase
VSANDHAAAYFAATADLANQIPLDRVEAMARDLVAVREGGGRLFLLGVGGGAGHASHAVNDFRKLAGIESYAPSDNVSELTARTNDDGWDTAYSAWLETSRLNERDALFVFSVGGGSREHNTSVNLVNAMELGKQRGAKLFGVCGVPGGTLADLADVVVQIDAPAALKTPLVESFQAVVWHALICQPELAVQAGHWEKLEAAQTSK